MDVPFSSFDYELSQHVSRQQQQQKKQQALHYINNGHERYLPVPTSAATQVDKGLSVERNGNNSNTMNNSSISHNTTHSHIVDPMRGKKATTSFWSWAFSGGNSGISTGEKESARYQPCSHNKFSSSLTNTVASQLDNVHQDGLANSNTAYGDFSNMAHNGVVNLSHSTDSVDFTQSSGSSTSLDQMSRLHDLGDCSMLKSWSEDNLLLSAVLESRADREALHLHTISGSGWSSQKAEIQYLDPAGHWSDLYHMNVNNGNMHADRRQSAPLSYDQLPYSKSPSRLEVSGHQHLRISHPTTSPTQAPHLPRKHSTTAEQVQQSLKQSKLQNADDNMREYLKHFAGPPVKPHNRNLRRESSGECEPRGA